MQVATASADAALAGLEPWQIALLTAGVTALVITVAQVMTPKPSPHLWPYGIDGLVFFLFLLQAACVGTKAKNAGTQSEFQ